MKKNCAVSIVSANYLAYAQVLADSLLEHNPDFHFRLLIVDRKTSQVDELAKSTGLEYIFAEDLKLDSAERIFYKYDIVELNTALKPTFIKYTFNQGYHNVLYLDPDIQVFSPLTPVTTALERSSIVLTPHSIGPIMDGARPSDVDFLRTGTFNLGFIGLRDSEQTRSMLDWWESRCLGMGFNDPSFGTFVDQKWIDLVPCYFNEVEILKHPGCNAAYWNLHERKIYSKDGQPVASGEQLIFFHFSGVNPNNPAVLSKHQTRHNLIEGTALANLVQQYCKRLLTAGHQRYAKQSYGFGFLSDGRPISVVMRRALLVVDYQENSPFDSRSKLQVDLANAGIALQPAPSIAKPANTINFNQNDRKVLAFIWLVRLINKIIGVERLSSILRFTAVLTRETHLPSVLLKKNLDLKHKLRY